MAHELKELERGVPLAFSIMGTSEAKHAIDAAKTIASSLGFSATGCEEIALVVSELASNLVKHAAGGTIKFSAMDANGRHGLQIISEDEGPGIPDVERAIMDGYSTAGSLGNGLGAINRLMDEIEFYRLSPRGTRVVCARWIRPPEVSPTKRWLEFGVATRAYQRQRENGDTFIIHRWDTYAIAGVIDGLGHGQFAQRASQTARQYIENHFDQPLINLFRGVGRACSATRGVVMALARFDLARETIAIGSVGNIEVRLMGNEKPLNLVVRRGIVGLNAPQPVVLEQGWTPTNLLLMHSDGLKTHWSWSDFPGILDETPTVIAQRLLIALGKLEDDVTVLVARTARS